MVKEVELWKQEMELLSDQSEFSMYVCSKISGIVPREIGWAGIKWTFYMAGIKDVNNDTGSRIMETGNGIIVWPITDQ